MTKPKIQPLIRPLIKLTTPFQKTDLKNLRAGDEVLLSGSLFTARDAAHKRLCDGFLSGKEPSFSLEGAVIYYVGPTPTKPGEIIGSAGPTTSYRMDKFTPTLLSKGVLGMIGKGDRSEDVVKAMISYGAVYFIAIGGAGALISEAITESKIIMYEDLGAEAIRRLTVKEFPAIVGIDSLGGNIYKIGPEGVREKNSNPT